MNEYPNSAYESASQDTETIPFITESPTLMTEEEKEKRIRHFGLFGLSSVIYALFYTFCLYKNASGITYPFFTGGTLFYFFSSLKKLGISAKKDSAFYAVSIELLGISTFCTDNKNIISMNKWGIFILFFILFIHNFYQDKLWDIFKYLQAILQTMLGSLQALTRPVTDFKLYRKAEKIKEKDKMSSAAYIFIGILISLPLLIVVLSLLSSADIVFRSFIRDYIFIDWLSENFIGLSFSFLFSFFASYCILAYLEKRSIKEEITNKRIGEPLIAVTFTAILSLIYLLFSGIQIIYLFAGNMQLPEQYTYAEYAREGFFQLLFVCLINLVLVLVCLSRFKESKALKAILTIISLCTYIMIASSAMRMLLYIQYYDLTFLRFFVLWSLIVIFFLMTGILIHIYKEAFPLFKYCITVVTILYIAFSFSRPDYFIARYNITQMLEKEGTESGRPDYDTEYLLSLSADAAPAILNTKTLPALLDGPESSVRWIHDLESWKNDDMRNWHPNTYRPTTWMEKYLHYTHYDSILLVEHEGSKWRTFNLSRYTMKKCMNPFTMSLFTKNKCPVFYLLY